MSFITSPGTIISPLTAGGVAYGTGSQAKINSAGTAGQVLVSAGAGVPAFSSLSTVAVISFSGGTTGLTPNTPTGGAVILGGVLDTDNGGTGLTSFTSGGVVYASSTSALATGSALTFNGTNLFVSSLTVGPGAGAVATNTAVGVSALAANTSGDFGTAVGSEAGNKNTAGRFLVAIGRQAAYNNLSGNSNTAVGESAFFTNTAGADNTAIGQAALYSNTGSENTAVGSSALLLNGSGQYNTAMGRQALRSNTTASNNTAVGYQAGYSNTTGTPNTAIGYQALQTNVTGAGNTAIGYKTLNNNTGARNTAVGGGDINNFNSPLQANSTGTDNSALGTGALSNNTSGTSNTAVGVAALVNNTTASNNTAVGYQAGYANVTGASNAFFGGSSGLVATGSSNTFLGVGAGELVTSGAKNTIVGRYNGNTGGLDIRTASNYIVLSDGDGNPRGLFGPNGEFGIAGANYGTSGQVLTSAGSGAVPTWASTSMTLLSTVTASNSATVDVETTFSSTYDAYMLVISGATPATNTVSLQARMKIGGSYISTATYLQLAGYNSTGGNAVGTALSLVSEITLNSVVWGNDAASSCDVVMYLFNPASTAFRKQIRFEAVSSRIDTDTGTTQLYSSSGAASNDGTGALTGIRFFASSGNISAGKFRLYGIANS